MSFKSARVKAGLSVPQVVKALGVSDAAVYQWETGVTKPLISRLPQIAKLYSCSIEELLTEGEE